MYDVYGCSDTSADNYLSYVTSARNGMCQFGGCNDTLATNFDSKVRHNTHPRLVMDSTGGTQYSSDVGANRICCFTLCDTLRQLLC